MDGERTFSTENGWPAKLKMNPLQRTRIDRMKKVREIDILLRLYCHGGKGWQTGRFSAAGGSGPGMLFY
jgi:hypothetical protein